jgi:Domain of unknown function (DUF4307)
VSPTGPTAQTGPGDRSTRAARAGRPDGRPVQRYGAPRPWSRPLAITLTAALALAGLGWLVWAGLYHAQPAVSERLRAFRVLGPGMVSATIDVEREPGTAVVCLLEAQASDHFVVGERQVRIAAGPQQAVSRTYRIETERPATNAVLDGCSPQR